jgi:murein DD-endopeptidase MepM/ murein hydrolase activator NlpD
MLLGVMVLSSTPAGAQSTRQRLNEARRRVSGLKSEYLRIADSYAQQERALTQTDVRIARTRNDINRSQGELGRLSDQLRDRVRTAYRMGGVGFFQFLLDARSFRDFSLRFITLQRQSLGDEDLILKLRKKTAELESQQQELDRQRSAHKNQLAALKQQGRRLTISLDQAEVVRRRYAGQLAAEAIAGLFRVGGRSVGGMRVPLDACPVAGPHTFSNDWGNPRGGGTRRHQGNDIMAPSGTPVVAPVSGTISRWRSGGAGGIAMYLWGSDHNEYYFAHNTRNIAPAGSSVGAGQTIATVGNTGNARGGAPHLHFEIHPGGGGAINPYPSLITVC